MADTNPPNRTPPHLRAVRDGESPPRRNPRLTQTQRLQIMGMIETHLLNGIRRKQIFNMLRQAAEKGMPMPDGSRTFLPRVSQTLFQQMLSEIDAEIAEDARQSLQQNRQHFIQRNMRHMRDAERKGNWTAVKGFEELIAKVQGVFAPQHVSVAFGISENLGRIIGDLSNDEARAIAEQQYDLQRKAALYEQAIDAPGEPMPCDPLPALPPRPQSETG